MTSLLDANILIDARKAGVLPQLIAAAKSVPWRLTREVFDELSQEPGRGQLRSLVRESPLLESSEARLCEALVTGGAWQKLGIGEAASIAAASHDAALEFVTWDRVSAWRALHELRGRTLVGHDWLRRLVEAGAISNDAARAVAGADQSRRHPAWWDGNPM